MTASPPAPPPAPPPPSPSVGAAGRRDDLAPLVRAAQRGDQLATDQLLDRLTPYVGRLCGPIALADGPDAAQEALIAVFRNLPQLKEPAALFGWVRAIAVREAVRVARASSKDLPSELADVPAPGDPQLAADVHGLAAGVGSGSAPSTRTASAPSSPST